MERRRERVNMVIEMGGGLGVIGAFGLALA